MTRPVVHLVDGTLELFRCFHGAPRAKDADGNEVGAARALLWTLLKLLRKEGGTHVAVAFDLMGPPDRRDGSADALLREQQRLAMDVTRALGLQVWPAVRNQADDLLASGAARLRASADVVICTTDKDLLQCVRGAEVVLRDRIRSRTTDEAGLFDRFGVRPEQIPTRSALVGDPSDGLPGVPGWGSKAAATVLGAYPTLEDIPADGASWRVKVRGAARLADRLQARMTEAVLVRALATLRTDLPVPDDPDALRWRGPTDELDGLARRLDSAELLEKMAQLVRERA